MHSLVNLASILYSKWIHFLFFVLVAPILLLCCSIESATPLSQLAQCSRKFEVSLNHSSLPHNLPSDTASRAPDAISNTNAFSSLGQSFSLPGVSLRMSSPSVIFP